VEDPTFHPVGAFVDGACVGAPGTISFGVTVPGGATMAMAGVTGTGVLATHRRRGYLRLMMQAMFDTALERGTIGDAQRQRGQHLRPIRLGAGDLPRQAGDRP